jgi:hypothetical protein
MPLLDLEDLDTRVVEGLKKRLKREWAVKRTLLEIESRRYARARIENRKSVDGVGRPRLEVPTESYHYWGQRLGYQCWRNEQFLREYERDNPQTKVKAAGTKPQFGFVGGWQATPRKFVKKYDSCEQLITSTS